MKYIKKEDYVSNPCTYYFEAAMEIVFIMFLFIFWHAEYKKRYQ